MPSVAQRHLQVREGGRRILVNVALFVKDHVGSMLRPG
jgi:hypothetical protein